MLLLKKLGKRLERLKSRFFRKLAANDWRAVSIIAGDIREVENKMAGQFFPHTPCLHAKKFSPTDIANCEFWVDADDASTITEVTGVSVWADKSGDGNDAEQASTTLQPIYNSNSGPNGRGYITFDGTDDYVSAVNPAGGEWEDQPYTTFFAGIPAMDDAAGAFLDMTHTRVGGLSLNMSDVVNGTTIRTYAAGTLTNLTVNGVNQWQVFNAKINGASSAHDSTDSTVGELTGDAGVGWDSIGGVDEGVHIGARAGLGSYANCRVGEVIVYKRALTDAERAKVVAYLEAKWIGTTPAEDLVATLNALGTVDVLLQAEVGLTIATGVSNWADQSGLGHHMVQASTTLQPLIALNAIGGKDALRFDGVDDWMTAAWARSQPVDMLIACVPSRSDSVSKTIVDGSASWFLVDTLGTDIRYYGGVDNLQVASTFDAAQLIHVHSEGASSTLSVDGGTADTGTVNDPGPGGLTVGARGSSKSLFGDTDVSLIVSYTSITPANLVLAQAAINAYYGL